MMQTSLFQKLKIKFDHWRETASQRHALLYGGHDLAKDLGTSYATLQFEAQRHSKSFGKRTKKPVVQFSSKAFHKTRMLH